MLSKEPQGLLCSCGTRLVAVKHKVDSIDTKLSGEVNDFFALFLSHAVGQDAEGGDAEVVKVDDVVEAFDEYQAVLLDEFAVAGFF